MNTVQNHPYSFKPGEISSLVRKALSTASSSGGALIPQSLEKLITTAVIELVPEMAVIDPVRVYSNYHEFDRLTALPGGHGVIGELGVTPTSNSQYERVGRYLKNFRRKGAVTGFLMDTSEQFIDAKAVEMENHVQVHGYNIATQLVWGHDMADPYAPPGLDSFIQTNRDVGTRGGTVPTDLSMLDDMIDNNDRLQGSNHRRVFLMSPEMLSKVSRLLTNVRKNQDEGGGLTRVSIPGGWRLSAYRDVPIVTTTRTRNDVQMGTVTPSKADTGGTIAADEWFFEVSFIDINGESVASAEVSVTTVAATSLVKLEWADVPSAVYYKVYCGTASGGAKLVAILPATTYDSVGTPTGRVTEVTFSTTPTTRNPTVSAPAELVLTLPAVATPVTAKMANDIPIVQTGGVTPERIIFWDLDKVQGLGKFAYGNSSGSRFGGLITMEPKASTDDNWPFLLKTYGTLIDAFEKSSYIAMNVRRK